jgi:hypothetical protein
VEENEMESGHAEIGTVLERDSACIVFPPNGDPELLIPGFDDEEEVPERILAVTAMYMRWCKDDEWRDDLARWFAEQSRDG